MLRPLGRFETALTLTGEHAPFVVVVVLRLAGAPGGDALRRALDALQARHAMLRARIVRRPGGGFAFAGGAPPVPLHLAPRRGEDGWRRVAEDELAIPVDRERGPLLRCTLVAPPAAVDGGDGEDRGSEVVLTFHHAIMDAASGAALVAELLALLAGGASSPTETDDPLFPAVEERFPAPVRGLRGGLRLAAFAARQAVDEVAYRLRRGPRPAPAEPAEPARCRILPLALPASESAALVRRARRARVTLNAVLTAALLLAVRRHLHAGPPAAPLRYVTFGDLRPHLAPPLPPDRLGCAVSMLRYTARPAPGAGLWPLAAAIARRVDRGGRRGEPFLAARSSAAAMRFLLRRRRERMAAVALSYSGAARFGDQAGAVRGSHVFVSNLGVGPQYTANARWFRDRLQLDVVYLEGDMDAALARRLADDVLATLTAEEAP